MLRITAGMLGCTLALAAQAAPATYNVEPNHTAPAVEVDHMGGLSILRGKFTRTSGTVVYDAEAKSGTVDLSIDVNSIDFGLPKFEEHLKSPEMFDAAKFPTATYKGKLAKFKGAMPTEVVGDLTLHGVTKPVTLTITQFLCKPHPMMKKEVCGADANGTLNRKDFGIGYGDQMGFKMPVKLLVSIEAIKAE